MLGHLFKALAKAGALLFRFLMKAACCFVSAESNIIKLGKR